MVEGEPGPGGQSSHGANAGAAKGKFAVYDLVEHKAPKNFFEAAEAGDVDMIIRMIERTLDFDINQKDKLGRTALHWAVEAGQQDAVEALLDFGINVKVTDCIGRIAVHLAARLGDAAMLKLLLKSQSTASKEELVNWSDQYHITPVYLALQKGEEGQEAFNFLMACGGHYNQNAPLAVDPATYPPTS